MSAGNRKSVDRVAATLFALLKSAPGRHRVLTGDYQAARKAVNTLLEQLGDNVLTETLHELYRIAEADARKRACGPAIAMRDRLHPKRIILDPPPPKPDRSTP